MNCPECRTENLSGSKFCKKCGTPITPVLETGKRTMLCPNGHVMDASWDVCPYCPKPSSATSLTHQTRVASCDDDQKRRSPDEATQPTDQATDSGAMSIRSRSGSGTGPVTEPLTSHPPRKRDETVIISETGQTDAQPERTLVGWLVTFSHKREGQDYRIREGRNLIGSSSDCEIGLKDPAVSGTHAIVMYRAGKFVIEDQLSTNGTWVNGEDVGPRGVLPLKDSDLVKVGDTTFVFKCFSWPEE